jgi:hypothetical protein
VLRAYLRLVLFALGLLAGVQVPGFVDQYAKRVSAHYLESTKSIAGFQRTANQYFGGSIDALIAHHEASSDSVFKDEARDVAALYLRLKKLTIEFDAMNQPLLSRFMHVAFRPDREILGETITAYSYTVPLNEEAIICGLVAGLLLALFVESVLIGLVRLGRWMTAGPRSAAAAASHHRH